MAQTGEAGAWSDGDLLLYLMLGERRGGEETQTPSCESEYLEGGMNQGNDP